MLVFLAALHHILALRALSAALRSVAARPGNPQRWPIPQATRTRLVMLQVSLIAHGNAIWVP